MTILDAVKQVMSIQDRPLTATEIYNAIAERKLYSFRTTDPIHVIRTVIRRHCEGLDLVAGSKDKHFCLVDNNKYRLQTNVSNGSNDISVGLRQKKVVDPRCQTARGLLPLVYDAHETYLSSLKSTLLEDLKKIKPDQFERFARRLLDAYGFHETCVTQISHDGGLDGYGRLRVGLAELRVAFQCKRWTKGRIQRPEIDRFRGASQGQFEQGLFFTTSGFSSGAIEASTKPGAIPIVLIDGPLLVDLMIEKSLGVQVESLSIPTYALDIALENNE